MEEWIQVPVCAPLKIIKNYKKQKFYKFEKVCYNCIIEVERNKFRFNRL